MDIRHIQKYGYIPENDRESNLKCGHEYEYRKSNLKCGHEYEYIQGNVRKSNLKCGNYQAQMKELYTNFTEKIDEAGMRAEILKCDNHQHGCHQ